MDEEVPDSLPDEKDFHEQSAVELMNTLQGFCEESDLPRISVIGALEAVKLTLSCNWQNENLD